MGKIIALLKKDIRLQIRNGKEILGAIVAAIAMIMLLNASDSVEFKVGIENTLRDRVEFNGENDSIVVSFMDSDVNVDTVFDSREVIEDKLKNNNYPVIAYDDGGEVALKMNMKDPRGLPTYFLLSRYFNGVTEDNFKTDYTSSASNTTLIFVITMVLIYGGVSRGSNVIFQEKNDGTLNILYKSGLSSFGIILAKTIFTILVMLVILVGVAIYSYYSGTVVMISGVSDVLCMGFILIPVAILGIFTGIIAKSIEGNRTLQLFLFMPAMFFTIISSKIPEAYHWIIRLHPGIAVIDFYESSISGHFDFFLFVAISIVSCIMFAVNVMLLRKAAQKSI